LVPAGRKILVSSGYLLMRERYPGQVATCCDPHEWVEDIVAHESYFNDWTNPWYARTPPAPAAE
jgi:hypothetical protein